MSEGRKHHGSDQKVDQVAGGQERPVAQAPDAVDPLLDQDRHGKEGGEGPQEGHDLRPQRREEGYEQHRAEERRRHENRECHERVLQDVLFEPGRLRHLFLLRFTSLVRCQVGHALLNVDDAVGFPRHLACEALRASDRRSLVLQAATPRIRNHHGLVLDLRDAVRQVEQCLDAVAARRASPSVRAGGVRFQLVEVLVAQALPVQHQRSRLSLVSFPVCPGPFQIPLELGEQELMLPLLADRGEADHNEEANKTLNPFHEDEEGASAKQPERQAGSRSVPTMLLHLLSHFEWLLYRDPHVKQEGHYDAGHQDGKTASALHHGLEPEDAIVGAPDHLPGLLPDVGAERPPHVAAEDAVQGLEHRDDDEQGPQEDHNDQVVSQDHEQDRQVEDPREEAGAVLGPLKRPFAYVPDEVWHVVLHAVQRPRDDAKVPTIHVFGLMRLASLDQV
mmetsp:Transcript_6368/g.15749  ORF Transcript_6368/g.15749 Transcript_6368/m.15749 type:complete len:448 (-) Transcript_6368:628-1971(-)